MYKLLQNSDSILRLSDNAIIPNAPGNRLWDEYQTWLSLGNTPLDADDLSATENKTPDWLGLLGEVRATPTFAKIYSASKDSLPVNVAYTLLLATLTSNFPDINDLAFALHDLGTNMTELDRTDIEFINQVLAKYNFPVSMPAA